MRRTLTMFAAVLMFAALVVAQPNRDHCVIEPGEYCTFTQGGWGNNCAGNNPGCLRDTYFATVFPAGLTIGGGFTIHFTNANAVRLFLPAGTAPDVLTQNHVNPTSNVEAGVFAGQVTALALSVGFGDAGVNGMADIGFLLVDIGPFSGLSVDQILALANAVLGGDLSGLPVGTDVSDLNQVVDDINQNFDNCNSNLEVLIIPPDCQNETPCPIQPPIWVEIGGTFCLDFCGNPIEVYWCCPLDGQPVFFLQPCANGAPLPVVTWVASYDSTGLECQAPGGYWHAVFEADSGSCVCVLFDRQLAVEMLNFTAQPLNGSIALNWATASENGNDHFEIFRDGVKLSEVNGVGVSNSRTNYSWTDHNITVGQIYSYELMTEDVNGIRRSHGTRTVEAGGNNSALITEFALHQNFPNPFNPTTSISFDVPTASNITLSVTNALGLEIAQLVNGRVESGSHTVQFDATGLPSGIYFYVLKAGTFSSTHKMLLLK